MCVVVIYDGGVLVFDGKIFEMIGEVLFGGFLCVNSVGDYDGYVFVIVEDGFYVFDSGFVFDVVEFMGEVFEVVVVGYVILYVGCMVLFDDGIGEVCVFDMDVIGIGMFFEVDIFIFEVVYYGVVIEFVDGIVLLMIGIVEVCLGVWYLVVDGIEFVCSE